MPEKSFEAVVDRIEEGMAVITAGDDEATLPTSLLPEGIEGGAHLRISISTDEASQAASKERIKDLQKKLEERG